MPNYKTKFNKKWMKLFSWVSEVDDDIHKAYCKVCKCEMKIHVGGVSSLRQHKETAKHKSITSKMVSKSKRDSKDKILHVSSNDDTMEENLDSSAASNQEEPNDFETCWFDPDPAADTSTTTSPTHLEREEKPISKTISTQMVHRNDRTLSEQRMKMFEAELRVWQRKGEAIVKLMETVGHDEKMWEIINKQSRLHERERDRIREEYDIL